MPQCRGDTWSRDPDGAHLANKRMVFCSWGARLRYFRNFTAPVMFSSVTNLDVWCMLCLVSLRSLQSNTLGRWSFA